MVQLLKHWLCDVYLGVAQKNWVHSVKPCWLQVLWYQCISICCVYSQVLRFHPDSKSCSQSDQQQATKLWPWPIFGASLVLGSAVWLLLCPTTELVVTDCCVKSTFHPRYIWSRNCSLLLHTVREDNATKWRFLNFGSSHEAPTYRAFSPFLFASNAEWL